MIIARITGGLGNQLFQYAFARNLAIKNNVELKFDISEYKSWKLRKFELGKFRIQGKVASEKELKSFLKNTYFFPKVIQPRFHQLFRFLYPRIIYEKHFHFDKKMMLLNDDVYLVGFWQSDKYFSDIEDILRNELVLANPTSEKSRELLKKINSVNSVSINFRRGEFVTDPQINRRHGVLDLDYYQRAVRLIARKVKRPHFFVFSDEMEWVKENFRSKYDVTFVDFNYPDRVCEDLVLGSFCKYNIIANSTFSWWVAWLNNYPGKIVVAPYKWFNLLSYKTDDLIPKSWLRF